MSVRYGCCSAFVLADEGDVTMIVTACHVVTDEVADERARMAIAVDPGPASDRYELELVTAWHLRPDVNLAIGRVERADLTGFAVDLGPWPLHHDVLSIEHSSSIK